MRRKKYRAVQLTELDAKNTLQLAYQIQKSLTIHNYRKDHISQLPEQNGPVLVA